MSATLIVVGILLAALSGLPGLFLARGGPAGERIATALLCAGAVLGLTGAALVLGGAGVSLDLPWAVPGGRFALRIDALAAWFLGPVFLVSTLGSIYGLGYWAERDHPDTGRRLRFFYGLLTAGLAGVVVSHNTVLFVVSWEVMALSAFMLVTTEDHDPAVRDAGLVYLIATRAGTLLIISFFALLYAVTGTLDFAIPAGLVVAPGARTALFVLGLLGFGFKAGIMPLHLWLPGAHANAPSHVSALMSGVLIKMGIYGVLRTAFLFSDPPLWWGGLLVGLGVSSGVLGVVFAIGQHDLKRLLAYHSVENIGIIVLGLGLALVGRSTGSQALVTLGLAGALLHVVNHSLFKALLFLSAGAVIHATETREIDALGGLAKAMPRTAIAFFIGAVAISGLPPLNGFVSEYLLYVGMLRSVGGDPGRAWLASVAGVAGLALIGALAVACFVKVFGTVFLGTARTEHARHAHEPGLAMQFSMGVLMVGCAFIGLGSPLLAPLLERAVRGAGVVSPTIASLAPLGWVSALGALLVVVLALGAGLLSLARRRSVEATSGTWDCGYVAPTASMQYTSSSFAGILVGLFGWALHPEVHEKPVSGSFPGPSSFHSHVPDVALDRVARPLFDRVADLFGRLDWLQRGSIHAYLLYVFVALVLCLLRWH